MEEFVEKEVLSLLELSNFVFKAKYINKDFKKF